MWNFRCVLYLFIFRVIVQKRFHRSNLYPLTYLPNRAMIIKNFQNLELFSFYHYHI